MKFCLSLAAALLVSSIQAAAAQPGSPDGGILSLFKTGQQVILQEQTAGYRLTLGMQGPGREEQLLVKQAQAARDIAAAELESAQTANQRVPGTTPEDIIRRLQLVLHDRTIQLERARLQAEATAWEVFAVGSDYLGLRSEDREIFLHANAIQAVIRPRQAEKGDAAPPAKQ